MILSEPSKTSLSHRFGFAVALITLLAFVSIVAAIFLIQQSGNTAAAINSAGLLRMQSYKISTSLFDTQNRFLNKEESFDYRSGEDQLDRLIEIFSANLYSDRFSNIRSGDPEAEPAKSYVLVETEWKRHIVPMLNQIQQFRPGSAEYIALSGQYAEQVNIFVSEIDRFVLSLQTHAINQIRVLGLITLFCVFCTVGVAYGVMYLLNISVIVPLADLLDLARKFKSGDFKARSNNVNSDELGVLAQTYNQMANSITQQYERLENAVAEKTSELSRSNLTLEFLYNTSKKLAGDCEAETVRSILVELAKVAELNYLLLCYKPVIDSKFHELIDHGLSSGISKKQLAGAPDLLAAMAMNDDQHSDQPAVTNELVEGQNHYGFLYAEARQPLTAWKRQLLRNVADQLAASYSLQHQNAQERLLMLFEERAVIARELHDSLAQSLSYLKMQITRLKTLISRNAEQQMILDVSNELQEGLNAAYRNLRELLNTFRLKITYPSLQAALDITVKEFAEFSGVPIELNYNMQTCKLSPNEDIHVLQIVREAVSNAVKHASASQIEIHCNEAVDGKVTFSIIDDGIGINEEASKKYHYGLSIMKERANSLNGNVSVSARSDGGTEVFLAFIPHSNTEIAASNA